MNFKTPFKVLTTAALIGTLSLSAVAPGVASAATKTTSVVKAKETANLNIASVVLAKKADPSDKVLISYQLAGELLGNNSAMNGYEIVAIITEDGTVFDYQLFGEYAGNGTPVETLKQMADAGATTSISGDVKVGELADGKLATTDTPAELPGEEATFEVTEIAAINATTVEVKFNKAVDKDAATGIFGGTGASNLSKYSVGAVHPTEVTLSKDGKTATLKFTASVEGENAAVVVDPLVLAADDNKKTERYAKTLTYKDDVKPEVTAIKATTGTDKVTSATIEFSEPISAVEAIKVDGKALVSTTNYTLTPGATKLDLTGLDLDATKEHTVEIVNLKDTAKTNSGAANVTSYITKTFTATVDKTAPTVASVEPQNDNKLVVTFSKPVNLDTTAAANTIINLVDADLVDQTTTLLPTTAKFTAVGTDKTKYVVTLNASPFATNATTAKYTVKFLANALTDLQGNKLAAVTKDVTFTKDTAAPKLTNTAFRVNAEGEVKELLFTFDEDVDFVNPSDKGVAGKALTVLLADKSVDVEDSVEGNLAAVFGTATGKFTVEDNVVKYTLDAAVALSGKYELQVAAGKLKDTSLSAASNTNKVADFTFDFGTAKEDATFKATSANATVNVDKANVITVNFAEAVKGGTGEGSAALTSAYKLNGKALPEGSKITLDSTQKVATIVVPAGTIEETDANAILNVKGIVSKDGKKQLVEYTKTISVKDNVAPELKSATLTADNKLVVTLSEKVASIPTSTDFIVKINDKEVTTTPTFSAGTGSDLGKYVLNLSGLVKQGTAAVTDSEEGWYTSANATGTKDTLPQAAAGDKFTDASDTNKEYIYKAAGVNATGSEEGWYISSNSTTVADTLPQAAAGDKFTDASDTNKEYIYKAAGANVPAAAATPTYVDLDGSNSYVAANDIKIADGPLASFNLLNSSVITSVELSTKATGALTTSDAEGNKLVNNTTIKAK